MCVHSRIRSLIANTHVCTGAALPAPLRQHVLLVIPALRALTATDAALGTLSCNHVCVCVAPSMRKTFGALGCG